MFPPCSANSMPVVRLDLKFHIERGSAITYHGQGLGHRSHLAYDHGPPPTGISLPRSRHHLVGAVLCNGPEIRVIPLTE
jgi:hypothetical protein